MPYSQSILQSNISAYLHLFLMGCARMEVAASGNLFKSHHWKLQWDMQKGSSATNSMESPQYWGFVTQWRQIAVQRDASAIYLPTICNKFKELKYIHTDSKIIHPINERAFCGYTSTEDCSSITQLQRQWTAYWKTSSGIVSNMSKIDIVDSVCGGYFHTELNKSTSASRWWNFPLLIRELLRTEFNIITMDTYNIILQIASIVRKYSYRIMMSSWIEL